MNFQRLFLVIIGFIVLLGLDNSNGQDKENPDESINNNPDDNETIGKYLFDNNFRTQSYFEFIFVLQNFPIMNFKLRKKR